MSRLFFLFALCLFSTALMVVVAYPNGAPTATCSSMIPSHGSNAQTSYSPYRVSSLTGCYSAGRPITLQISGGNFDGFLVEARSTAGNLDNIGSFTAINTLQSKTITCNNPADALTHSSPVSKLYINFNWTASASAPSQIIFRLTAVQSYSTFWTNADTTVSLCATQSSPSTITFSTPSTTTSMRTTTTTATTTKTTTTTTTRRPTFSTSTTTTTIKSSATTTKIRGRKPNRGRGHGRGGYSFDSDSDSYDY